MNIPLVRTDLTPANAQAVRWQLARAPFADDGLLARWEAAWEKQWQRPAVAFATTTELIRALKNILGWHSGDLVGSDPLLDPAWSEALAAAWLHLSWRDVNPRTGQGQGLFTAPETPSPCAGTPKVGFVTHAYGLPTTRPVQLLPFYLEEISSVLQPLPDCGWGDAQLLHLSGNRILAAGGSCLLLTKNEDLCHALRHIRQHPPSPLACALGLSQLPEMEARIARRHQLAERYLELRSRGVFQLPTATTERVWEMWLLEMNSSTEFLDLQQFLQKARIHAASPLWFRTATTEHLPGLQQFRQRVLALPLYASLTDPEHKRICNRIHRWVEYTTKRKPLPSHDNE